jgi:hypothetical protein
LSSLKTRLEKLEDRLKPDRRGGIAVNWIGTKDELSQEEIKRLKSENYSILTVSFVD